MRSGILTFSTVPSKKLGDKIAKTLVEQNLAACVQVLGPMTSTYSWKGKVETSKEWIVLIKSDILHYPDIEKAVKKEHPYDTPELFFVGIDGGSTEYLGWLEKSLDKKNKKQ